MLHQWRVGISVILLSLGQRDRGPPRLSNDSESQYFEVICYEGKVGVTYQNQQKTLLAGDSFLMIDGKLIAKEKEKLATPSWLNNESQFTSMPYRIVLDEFERQYNVTFDPTNVDLSLLYTGGFSHNNMDLALKAITLPLHVTYSKTNNTITLKRD